MSLCIATTAGGPCGFPLPCPIHSTGDDNWLSKAAVCPTQTPESHLLGEFPMSCYRCHMEADS